MRKVFTFLMILIAFNASALDPAHFTINRISAPYFIVDGNVPATINKAYVGFEITNNSGSGVTYANLRFNIVSIGTSVAGQNYSIVSPASGQTNVGTLAPGQSKTCYFYVQYPASVTPQATFNISLTDLTATAKTQSFIIRNRSSISANAGGTATQTFTNQDIIGGIILDDVTYTVGNVQNGDENDFQVAVSSQFDPTKITLLGTQVIASSVPGINVGVTDSLYFLSGNGSNGATVTIRWTFRITGFNFTTYLLPCAGATSGSTNYKYALNTSLGSGTPITVSSTANPLVISKVSDSPIYGVSSTATFTITIQNPGAFPVTIDRITDQIPAGFTFQALHSESGVTTANSTAVPALNATGNITFEGGVTSGSNVSYVVPAGGNLILKYTAISASASASNLLTTARHYSGTTELGSANNTVSVSSTLPLQLLSWKATRTGDKLRLEWSTAAEQNSSHFEIERRVPGGSFQKVGSVQALNDPARESFYSLVDHMPVRGFSEYRLRIVDRDDKFEYGRILSVDYSGSGSILVSRTYPNPFRDEISIDMTTERNGLVQIEIIDMNGRMCLKRGIQCRQGANQLTLKGFAHFKEGIYVLKISDGLSTHQSLLLRSQN